MPGTSVSKNICFVDKAATSRLWLPARLTGHEEWSKNLPPRGKFLKCAKQSFTESVFKQERQKVAPNAY